MEIEAVFGGLIIISDLGMEHRNPQREGAPSKLARERLAKVVTPTYGAKIATM